MAHVKECSGDAGGPKFSPPLYKQRYAAVVDLARKLQPSKVGFVCGCDIYIRAEFVVQV